MIEKWVIFKRDYLEISFLRENCGYDGSDERRRYICSMLVFVGILSFIYIGTHHTISSKRKLHRCYLTPKIKYVSETVFEVPTKNNEGNSSFRMGKCQKVLSSLASLARIYIHFLNVSVLSVYCHLYHTISDKRKMH